MADRLATARRGRFVGRQDELALFRAALHVDEPPFVVLFVYGPGGVGKTTLLREFGSIAAECGRPVVSLDGRAVEPNPDGFLRALREASGPTTDIAADALAGWPPGGVLLIDTYETLAPLDPWLRETFLPQLPGTSLVVLAGRNPPAPAWRADLAWGDLLRDLPLGNLGAEESEAFLAARGVPAAHRAAVRAFTHGHPLALALVADTLRQGGELTTFDPHGAPDVVRALLERLVREVLTPDQRRVLELCALAHVTTEALLADVLDGADAHALFAWLRGLSFIEQGPRGLFPHDLAREVLDGDLRWRNPAEYGRLRDRVTAHVRTGVKRATGIELQRLGLDLLYLSRHDPFMGPYFDWGAFDSAVAVPATPDDAAPIVAMVRAHEGDASARIAEHWLRRQPEAFLAFRTPAGALFGFMANLFLQDATPEDRAIDPATAAALDFAARQGPLRPGEELLYLRFWMSRETYQRVGPAINLAASNSVLRWTTHSRLAWNFIAVADPDFMAPHFTGIHMWRSPAADFTVAGRRYGVFSHDWRVEPVSAWRHLYPHHLAAPDATPAIPSPPARPPLSRDEFTEAVRAALRDYTRPDRLAENPLLRTGMLGAAAESSPAALQATLREALAGLAVNPRDVKFHRAVWHTYIEPAPTQEQAAELLGLPFNTYRYQLAKGIGEIAERLWRVSHGVGR
jgi:hypothetical protein